MVLKGGLEPGIGILEDRPAHRDVVGLVHGVGPVEVEVELLGDDRRLDGRVEGVHGVRAVREPVVLPCLPSSA